MTAQKKAAKKVAKKVATKPEPVEQVSPAPEPVKAFDKSIPIAELYPEAPGLDSGFGDKDPTFCRWLLENHPEDYRQRFIGRKSPLDKQSKGPSITQQSVKAQLEGFEDASKRRGFQPQEYGYEGILLKEYTVGFKNAGGIV